MADFTDRIKLVFEAVTSDAAKDMGKLKSGADEAHGGFGKLKDMAGQAISTIAQSPAAVAAAGVAIGKVAFDLAASFSTAALEANNFATASGLSVEQASRWQEVADDVGVSTETLAGAVNKMDLAADKGVLEKLGIGGADTNEKLLNSLTHLQGITDAGERASTGAAIFGKSWANLAPLVDDAQNLRANLAAVSDQKVIDQAEVEKAKHFRDAIDGLVDKLDDLKMAVGGELIEPIADLAEGFGNVADAVGGVTDALPGMDGGLLGIATGPLRNVTDGFNTLTDSSNSLGDRARGLGQTITGAIPGPLGSWAGGLFDVSDKADEAAEAAERSAAAAHVQAQAAQDAAAAIAEQEAALNKLTSATLASFSGQLQVAEAANKTEDAVAAYTVALDTASASSFGNKTANDELADTQRGAEQAALAQAAAAAKLATDQATANGTTLSAGEAANIQADALRSVAGTMAVGSPLRTSLENYAGQLEALPATKSTTIEADTETASQKVSALTNQIFAIAGKIFHVQVGATTSTSAAPSSAAPAGVSSTATAGAGGLMAVPFATPAPRAAAPATVINVTVTAAPLTNPAEIGSKVADYLDAFYRRNGNRPRAVA